MKKQKHNFKRTISGVLAFTLMFSSVPFTKVSKAATEPDPASNNQAQTAPISKVELKSLNNETSKVYANANGTYTAEVYTKPIHYKKNNKWVDIDNTLDENNNGEYENKSNSFKVKFPKKPKKGNESKLYTYSTKGHDISIEFIDESVEKRKVHHGLTNTTLVNEGKNEVKYPKIYDGVTFQYSVDSSKVKENIVLDSYKGKNIFKFHMLGQGMKAEKKADDTIEFTDEKTGEFLFFIQSPFMYDSSESKSISNQVSQEISEVDDGFILTLTADESYLTDPKRVYPVTIDPWLDNFKTSDIFVSSSKDYGFSLYDFLSVGNDPTYGKTRTYLRWNPLPDIPNAEVVDGSIGICQTVSNADIPISLHRLTQSYSTSTVNWSNQPNYNPTPEATVSRRDAGYLYFQVGELVRDWYNKKTSPFGVVLKYPDAQEGSANKKFNSTEWVNPNGTLVGEPKLVITYRPKELLGITDYWTYTPDLFQGEGTAIANVINGNMIYDLPVLSLPGRTDAFNLHLVYNSRSSYSDAYGMGWTFSAQRKLIVNSDKSVVEYIDENGTRYHFSKNQYDTSTSYSAPEGTYFDLSSTDSGFVIKQPDETVFEFDSNGRNTKVKDEKGNVIVYSFDGTSNRVLKISERYKTDTTGKDLALTYSPITGLLDTITDFKGTQTKFEYQAVNGNNQLMSVTFAYNRSQKEQTKISYGYNQVSGLLETISDMDGHIGTIRYDNNRVTEILDPRSTASNPIVSKLQYPSQTETVFTDAKGYKTYYKNNWDPVKPTVNVIEVTEDYQGKDPSTTKYEWDKNNIEKEILPTKENGVADGTIVNSANFDEKDNLTIASGQNKSGVINNYDSKSNLVKESINGGGFYTYRYDELSNLVSTTNPYQITNYSSYDKYGNPVSQSNSTYLALNKLLNSNFEQTDTSSYPTKWSRSTKGQFVSSTSRLFGKKSGQVTLSSTDSGGYYYQRVPVRENGTTFTMAGYIKTDLTGKGAQFRVYPIDDVGQYIKNGDGSIISFISPALTGSNDWTRIHSTFTVPANTKTLQFETLTQGVGTAIFDGVQLSYGSNLGRFYDNENAGMEEVDSTTSPTSVYDWNLKTLGTGDGPTSYTAKHGNYSLKINGVSANRSIGQDVPVQGKAGDSLSLSGWANGIGTSESGGEFSLKLTYMYTDGTSESKSVPFLKSYPIDSNDSNVDKWQFVKKSLKASKDFSSVKMYAIYNNQAGVAYFDNIVLEEGASEESFEYSPDDGVNLISQTDALGNKSSFDYDENGNQRSITTGTGKQTKFGYDYSNRLTSTTLGKGLDSDPDNITVNYESDHQNNIKTRTDPRGNQTSYEYTELNQVKLITDPINKFERFTYDDNGNIKTAETGQFTASGESIKNQEKYNYDGKNRLSELLLNQAILYKYTYDHQDNLTDITLSDGSIYHYEYDESKRLSKYSEPNGYSIKNEYESDTSTSNTDASGFGERKSFTETLGSTVESTNYAYDVLKRVRSVVGPRNEKTSFYYNEDSLPVRVEQGTSNTYYEYDAAGKLTKQTTKGNNLLSLTQKYDADGNITSISNGFKTDSFTYDFAGRLDTWRNNGANTTYHYDKSGNLLNPNGKNLTFNSANEIEGFSYDEAGQLIQDESKKYQWDGEGNLVKITDLNGSTIATYTYDPTGLRKTKTIDKTSYHYYYDGSELIRVTDTDDQTLWTFTWANGKPVSLTNKNGSIFYYVTNYHGDILQIVDQNGVQVANYSYDPWGNVLSSNENVSISDQPLGYASYVYDKEIKQYYLQARYYDPLTARFISKDSADGITDNPFSYNPYIYANNNPIMFVDPNGNFAFLAAPVVLAAVGALALTYMTYLAVQNFKKNYPTNSSLSFSSAGAAWRYAQKLGNIAKNQFKGKNYQMIEYYKKGSRSPNLPRTTQRRPAWVYGNIKKFGIKIAQDKYGHKYENGIIEKPHVNVYIYSGGIVRANYHLFYPSNWNPRKNV